MRAYLKLKKALQKGAKKGIKTLKRKGTKK